MEFDATSSAVIAGVGVCLLFSFGILCFFAYRGYKAKGNDTKNEERDEIKGWNIEKRLFSGDSVRSTDSEDIEKGLFSTEQSKKQVERKHEPRESEGNTISSDHEHSLVESRNEHQEQKEETNLPIIMMKCEDSLQSTTECEKGLIMDTRKKSVDTQTPDAPQQRAMGTQVQIVPDKDLLLQQTESNIPRNPLLEQQREETESNIRSKSLLERQREQTESNVPRNEKNRETAEVKHKPPQRATFDDAKALPPHDWRCSSPNCPPIKTTATFNNRELNRMQKDNNQSERQQPIIRTIANQSKGQHWTDRLNGYRNNEKRHAQKFNVDREVQRAKALYSQTRRKREQLPRATIQESTLVTDVKEYLDFCRAEKGPSCPPSQESQDKNDAENLVTEMKAFMESYRSTLCSRLNAVRHRQIGKEESHWTHRFKSLQQNNYDLRRAKDLFTRRRIEREHQTRLSRHAHHQDDVDERQFCQRNEYSFTERKEQNVRRVLDELLIARGS